MTGHRPRAGKDGSYSRTRRIVGLMYFNVHFFFPPSILFSSLFRKRKSKYIVHSLVKSEGSSKKIFCLNLY